MTSLNVIFHHHRHFEFFQMYVFLVFTRDTVVWINLAWLLPRESFIKYILVNIHHNVIIQISTQYFMYTHTHTHLLYI